MPSSQVTVFAPPATSVTVAIFTATLAALAEHPAQRPGHAGRDDLRRSDLIEHRLELAVVVAVDQRHRHAVLGELLRAGDAREAAADNDDRGFRNGFGAFPARHPYNPGLLCMIPPSTKIVVAVR